MFCNVIAKHYLIVFIFKMHGSKTYRHSADYKRQNLIDNMVQGLEHPKTQRRKRDGEKTITLEASNKFHKREGDERRYGVNGKKQPHPEYF